MPESARSAAKARPHDAFAASGKALAGGRRLEPLDVLAQGERTVDAPAKAAGLNLATAGFSREEPRVRSAAGDVVVLDVRPVDEYRAGHIPGAGSLPVEELADRIGELPEDLEIVVHCRGEYCVLAHYAVRLLTGHGRRAIRLHDGVLEWRLSELSVDASDLT
ncbi:hypothetical protein GCM10010503_41070 [Streptomyces lucensis JCM 4490]|uniref:Rhodanese domain-containing protein n=1 Tax=Streptomyces lucensis JCM 4490 TaxID=1306176 RepID=A0A918J953_9ACTN|nr:rhodanese-like domain-containing protein [Streptomyces lucensis]GGW59657.1 hypothetical protein GCM10010503_41070 [Streptomyces lucensis JCM 4490]